MNLTQEKYEDAVTTFLDVVDHYGHSKYTNLRAELVLIYDPRTARMGEHTYDDEIIVNFAQCKSWKQVVETIIHEYVHYLQPRNWYNRHYDNGHTYASHPQEIEANLIAKRDTHLFL